MWGGGGVGERTQEECIGVEGRGASVLFTPHVTQILNRVD